MKEVFLSIGSNIDPASNIPRCLQLLQQMFHVKKISSVYETDPVGPAGKNRFWNLAVQIETDLTAKELKHKLGSIETTLGRIRNPADKYAPRTIDLDPLPQPDYEIQPFIIIPLAEINPDGKASDTGQTHRMLAENFSKEGFKIQKART